MKVLVLATGYPTPDGLISSYFIHIRNKQYIQRGIDVTVLSFSAQSDYIIDNIPVYTLKTYKISLKNVHFDILISHAPNIRNHYRFLKNYSDLYKNIVFFFHGHEVLKYSKIYPKPYSFRKKSSPIAALARDLYDFYKLKKWKDCFTQIAHKSQFVFVSNWMYNRFIEFTKLNTDILKERKHIIYNCIGNNFEEKSYDRQSKKIYDFITIRNLLDESKYCIDVVTKIAELNPQYCFCVVGRGEFYKYNKKPDNLIFIEKHLTHDEIINMLNKSMCALLPTRADAQGLMACEMATFGIPVITSDIDVCREIFGGFSNVDYISNDNLQIDIKPILNKLVSSYDIEKNTKYFSQNTIEKEIELFNNIENGKVINV